MTKSQMAITEGLRWSGYADEQILHSMEEVKTNRQVEEK